MDSTKAASLIRNENVLDSIATEPRVQFVVSALTDVLNRFREINEKASSDTENTVKVSSRRTFFSQSHVKVLTEAEQIACILLANKWRNIKSMKVAELHEDVKEYHALRHILKPGFSLFLNKATLLNLEYNRLKGKIEAVMASIEIRMGLYELERLPDIDNLPNRLLSMEIALSEEEVTVLAGSLAPAQ